MQSLGKHALVELYGCPFAKLDDIAMLEELTLSAIKASGATILSHHFKQFEPQGVSGVVVISESHLSFHTWPEYGYMALDYFTCGDKVDMEMCISMIETGLQSTRTERVLYKRGQVLGELPYKPDLAPLSPNDEVDRSELWRTEYHLDRELRRPMLSYGYRYQRQLHRERSEFQDISVVESAVYGRMLFLDGYMMTTEVDEFVYHEMLAHVPLSLHGNPRDVLIIGGGDGGLLREVLRHPSVERVDMVEIDGRVVEVCREYLPQLACAFDDARANLIFDDGAKFVREAASGSYDVVLVDSTDPIGPGKVLFERPFYRDVQRVLRREGLVSAQSLSPWLQKTEQREMYEALGQTWPEVTTYGATVPTYPGGQWTFALGSLRPLDVTDFDRKLATDVSGRYYSPEVHLAAFQVPHFVLDNTVKVARAAWAEHRAIDRRRRATELPGVEPRA